MNDASTLIGIIEYNEAKRLKNALEEKRKVSVELVSNPQTCSTGGCKITVEVYARPEDIPIISEHLEQERQLAYDGLNVDFEMHNQVFDTEKPEARCPACGTSFSTENSSCPECGLVFVLDKQD